MKYLITGLGNIGSEYLGTRHNIGFRVVNALVEDAGVPFTEERYGAIARMRIKNCELIILKPNTFMNLSGNAVRYWLQKENIPFAAGILYPNDIDYQLARLLAAEVITEKPFCAMSEETSPHSHIHREPALRKAERKCLAECPGFP